MFDKFGEFDSFHELNEAAEGLKTEGDTESLNELAKENGIDSEDVKDYLSGKYPFSTQITAAMGKLDVEESDLMPKLIMKDWTNYIRTLIATDEPMRTAVRKKNNSLKGCIAYLLKWSFDHMKDIDPDIKKAAGVTQKVKLGIPGIAESKKLIREYYLGGKR